MAFPYIFFVVAYGSFLFFIECGGDGEREFVDAVTAVGGSGQAVPDGVSAGLQGADFHVVAFPNVGFIVAGDTCAFSIEGRGDGQREFIDTVAAVGSGIQAIPDGVGASGQNADLHVVAFPNVGFVVAGDACVLRIEGRGDDQGKLINAVATIDGLQAVPNGVSAFRQNADFHIVAFPDIFLIVANCGGFRNEIYRVDSQCQRIDTVASGGSVIVGRMSAALANGSSLPYNRQLVGANGIVFSEGVYRIHGDFHFVHIVAAIIIVHSVGIKT